MRSSHASKSRQPVDATHAQVVVKAEKWAEAREASAARAAAEKAYEARVWADDRAPIPPLGSGRTAVVEADCVVSAAAAALLSVGSPATGEALEALCEASASVASVAAAAKPGVMDIRIVATAVMPMTDDEASVAAWKDRRRVASTPRLRA